MSAPRSLKSRALQWLAQREQSRSELRRKLLRVAVQTDRAVAASAVIASANAVEGMRGSSPELAGRAVGLLSVPNQPDAEPDAELATARVDALLDWLEANDFLSPERFVESRVHARASRFGNLRIRQELKQHQLTLPDELARSLNDSELQRARAVRARKFSAWPGDAAERSKQARYLAGRGFGPEAIARALRALPDDETAPDR